ARIEHTHAGARLEEVEERRSELRAGILYRDLALTEARQPADGHRVSQGDGRGRPWHLVRINGSAGELDQIRRPVGPRKVEPQRHGRMAVVGGEYRGTGLRPRGRDPLDDPC